MSAVDPAAYAEALLHLSARIVGTVRDEGPEAIGRAIDQALIVEAPAGVDPVHALVTILAAQVDASLRHSQSLAWLSDRTHQSDMAEIALSHARRPAEHLWGAA